MLSSLPQSKKRESPDDINTLSSESEFLNAGIPASAKVEYKL